MGAPPGSPVDSSRQLPSRPVEKGGGEPGAVASPVASGAPGVPPERTLPPVQGANPSLAVEPGKNTGERSVLDELKKLNELNAAGAITGEEYETAKVILLQKI